MKAKKIINEFSTLSNERRGTRQKGGEGGNGAWGWVSNMGEAMYLKL